MTTPTADAPHADLYTRLVRARKFACGWTSRWGKIACPGNDGKEHDDVCDSLTYAFDDELRKHERDIAAANERAEKAEAEAKRCAAGWDAIASVLAAARAERDRAVGERDVALAQEEKWRQTAGEETLERVALQARCAEGERLLRAALKSTCDPEGDLHRCHVVSNCACDEIDAYLATPAVPQGDAGGPTPYHRDDVCKVAGCGGLMVGGVCTRCPAPAIQGDAPASVGPWGPREACQELLASGCNDKGCQCCQHVRSLAERALAGGAPARPAEERAHTWAVSHGVCSGENHTRACSGVARLFEAFDEKADRVEELRRSVQGR